MKNPILSFPSPSTAERFTYICMGGTALISSTAILFFVFPFNLKELASLEDAGLGEYVVTVFMLGFGICLLWIAWSSRVIALPFRFTADASTPRCGYRWRSWWPRQIDLSDATKLEGTLKYTSTRAYQGSWRWAIYAIKGAQEKQVLIYSPSKTNSVEATAESECRSALENLSQHLELPCAFLSPVKRGSQPARS